jgi:hypothetical protein
MMCSHLNRPTARSCGSVTPRNATAICRGAWESRHDRFGRRAESIFEQCWPSWPHLPARSVGPAGHNLGVVPRVGWSRVYPRCWRFTCRKIVKPTRVRPQAGYSNRTEARSSTRLGWLPFRWSPAVPRHLRRLRLRGLRRTRSRDSVHTAGCGAAADADRSRTRLRFAS